MKPDHAPVFDEPVERACEVRVMDFDAANRAACEALLGSSAARTGSGLPNRRSGAYGRYGPADISTVDFQVAGSSTAVSM